MAISVTDIGSNQSTATATTLAITVGVGGVPAGALICLLTGEGLSVSYSTGGSTTDSVSNSYSQITHANANNTTNGWGILWHADNVAALSNGNTITLTKQTSSNPSSMTAFYATGIQKSSPLDTAVTNSATGQSTSPSVTSGTPAVSGELFIGGVMYPNNSTNQTLTNTGSWVTPFDNETQALGPGIGGGHQVNAGTGTIAFSPTLSALKSWAALVAGFKPAPPPPAAGDITILVLDAHRVNFQG